MARVAASPLGWIDAELARLDRHNLRRRRLVHDRRDAAQFQADGRQLINLGANDYLSLATDRRVVDAAREAAKTSGWGAGASPLLAGYGQLHRRLEERLAHFEHAEAALVFASGYAANVGAIGSLAGRGDVIYSDEKNHASIIDGCRLSRAEVRIYPHADTTALERRLKSSVGHRRRLIVTDGLFSMDGDLAPLPELADLAERYDAMLMVDEAHATGVFGQCGRGASEHFAVEDRIAVRVGTLSKALGSAGGFVAGSRSLIDWLVNTARPYIFSTALPPPVAAAANQAVDLVDAEPHRRAALLAAAADLRAWLRRECWDIGDSTSQVIPLIVGDAAVAVGLSQRLRDHGFYVPAIRAPSVAADSSRLRISLCYDHSAETIESLRRALQEIAKPGGRG